MSRCFPFPPPGYEKKIRIESIDKADSLIKENQKKEKKHRKDKKDKEKKEGKDKERSKDKHKERKEKKEKHKDRKYKDWDKEKSRASEDKNAASVLPNTRDREKLVTSTLQNNGNGESKFIQDFTRRIRDEEEATESRNPLNVPCGVKENNMSCPVPQTNHRKDNETRINTHRNFPMADQKGAEVMVKPVLKKELQETNHRREKVTKSDKPLYNEGINKGEPKNITDRSSQEKKEVINKTCQEKPKFVEGGPRLKERDVETTNFRVPDVSKATVKILTTDAILGKRKNLETNGLLYENGSRPNKIQRPGASPISAVENGRKMGACETVAKPVSEIQGTVCIPEVKEHRINGFIDSKEPKSQPHVSSVKKKENGEVSAKKRPHSDLKFLDQILNVPKREELNEVDYNEEQEWIFGKSGVKLVKKQRTDAITLLDETLQVWNQALRLESADVVALPYVVPF